MLAGDCVRPGLSRSGFVLATELVHGARWEHRVGSWGSRTQLRLADGREIDSDDVRGVLNRLLWIAADGFLGAPDSDREYAGGEFHALVQSWLESWAVAPSTARPGSGWAGHGGRRTSGGGWRARPGLRSGPYPSHTTRSSIRAGTGPRRRGD